MTDSKCPELDKLRAVSAESNKIGDFLDWLDEQQIFLCTHDPNARAYSGGQYGRILDRPEQLLARYFEIDLDKVETERRVLLDEQRALNKKAR